MPAIEIAGLCLPLKPQKERGRILVFTNRKFLKTPHGWINKMHKISSKGVNEQISFYMGIGDVGSQDQ